MEIHSALQDIIQKYSIDGQIGVAFSGGIDSAVLAHSLASVYDSRKIMLLYINHHLRDDAIAEEKFVINWSKSFQIELETFDLNIENRTNIEEKARKGRYEIFNSWAEQYKSLVFTGHHYNDQVETILYRIFTGTGINGLNGIREKMGSIIRPFLSVTRDQISEYAKQNRVDFFTDRSNFDNRFKRNVIRNKIIPMIMDGFGEKAGKNILHFKNHFDDYFIERDAVFSYLIKIKLIKYSHLQIIVDKRLFFFYFHSFTKYLFEKAISQVFAKEFIFSEQKWSEILGKVSASSEKLQLTEQLELFIAGDLIWIQDVSKKKPLIINRKELPGYTAKWYDWEINSAKVRSRKECHFSEMDIYLDADKTGEDLEISYPEKGQKIKKANNKFTNEIRTLFSQNNVPVPRRMRIPVIYQAHSRQLIGGPFLGTSELFEISENTKNIIAFHFKLTE